jgi:hypothetical protein
MIIVSIIKLPINLIIELLKFSDKLEQRNKGYLKYLWIEFKDRINGRS